MTEVIEKIDETGKLGVELSKSTLETEVGVNLEKAEFFKEEGNMAFKGKILKVNF